MSILIFSFIQSQHLSIVTVCAQELPTILLNLTKGGKMVTEFIFEISNNYCNCENNNPVIHSKKTVQQCTNWLLQNWEAILNCHHTKRKVRRKTDHTSGGRIPVFRTWPIPPYGLSKAKKLLSVGPFFSHYAHWQEKLTNGDHHNKVKQGKYSLRVNMVAYDNCTGSCQNAFNK